MTIQLLRLGSSPCLIIRVKKFRPFYKWLNTHLAVAKRGWEIMILDSRS